MERTGPKNRRRVCFIQFASYSIGGEVCRLRLKKVKAAHTRYSALGPELIPVYSQSALRDISHPPGGRLPYFPPGLRLPSQPQSITAPWPVPSYAAWWQRHIGVNNLPKVVTQLLPRVGFEPTTCWSHVQRSTLVSDSIWFFIRPPDVR